MSVQRITQSEMRSWFENNGIEQDERQMFTTIIMAVDEYWMKNRDTGSDPQPESSEHKAEKNNGNPTG